MAEHKDSASPPAAIHAAVITASDTRTLETDQGGALVQDMLTQAGFVVLGRHLVPDDSERLRDRVRELVTGSGQVPVGISVGSAATNASLSPPRLDVILVTGGTGIAPRDVTVDAITPLFERRLDGFGELFRMLSFAEIGAAAMLSRASAGILAGVAIFLIPGSPAAIRLALERLILPELGHLVSELRQQPVDAANGARQRHRHEHHHGPDRHH